MTRTSQSEELMRIEDLSVRYGATEPGGGTDAIDHVDLTINRGEYISVLGPSGCGKSTLLNVMGGLLRATHGVVTMLGEPVTDVDPKRAVVFQTPTLYPWMSVRENIAFGPKVRGISQAETDRRVDQYIQLVGLEEFAGVKPYELSGGMRQRVALARALVNDPEMILLDEPFGALDAFTRTTMQGLVRKIWKETGTTVFMITHDVDEALTLATRVLVMSERPGRILKEFPVDFTMQMEDSEGDARYSPEYIALRKEILSLIGHGH